MTRRFLLLFMLMLGLSARAADWRDDAWDELRQDYGWFVEHFSRQDWEPIAGYITDMTIINNDDHGLEGMKRVFSDERCRQAVTSALEQGCRRTSSRTSGGELLICLAPPRQSNPDVIYAGSSAQFWYDREKEQWELRYVNCHSD